MPTSESITEIARSFAEHHVSQQDRSWVFTHDLGELEHIRYRRDYTGYNVWYKRVWRTFGPSQWWKPSALERAIGITWRDKLSWLGIRANIHVNLRKDKNLPDGRVAGVITHWAEHGIYVSLFSPTVGSKVLDFLEAEPDHPHAQSIRDEIQVMWDLIRKEAEK